MSAADRNVDLISNRPFRCASEVKDLGVFGTHDFQPPREFQVVTNKVRAVLTRIIR